MGHVPMDETTTTEPEIRRDSLDSGPSGCSFATSIGLDQIAKALSKVQGALQPAKKSGTNPHFKSRFSTLEDCWDAIRALLPESGLSVSHFVDRDHKDRPCMVTVLLHSSGQWIRDLHPLILGQNVNAQAVGSAESYARRYALCNLFGLASTDDDGEAAVGRNSR